MNFVLSFLSTMLLLSTLAWRTAHRANKDTPWVQQFRRAPAGTCACPMGLENSALSKLLVELILQGTRRSMSQPFSVRV